MCDAADDLFFAGHDDVVSEPRQLLDHLTCPTTLMTFTGSEGAGAHCHVGAQRLAFGRMIDWLTATLADGKRHAV